MKKKISLLLCGVIVLGSLAGCGSNESNSSKVKKTTSETQESASSEKETNELVNIKVWHDGDESIMQTIENRVNDTLVEDNITVSFEKMSGLTDQIKLYGNDEENGPDMYMFAHDSLGTFVEMGVLAPITDVIEQDTMSNLLPMTISACTYKDTQYLLPIYFESLLFMYNKALWQGDIPDTTEELYTYMVANTDVDAGTYAVLNLHTNAYNVAPFINGYGGYVINKDGKPGLNEVATKEAIKYNQKFAMLQSNGDYNTVTTLFNDSKAAAIIGGPWLISGIKDAGIDIGIKSLSKFKLPNGNALAPYSGVQAVGVMKHAVASKKDALKKVLEVLAGSEVGVDLAKSSNCAPANQKSYNDSDVAANEMISAMKDTADTAQPMPNIPQMSVMWAPTESLLVAINKSGADIDSTADKYQKEALIAIGDMQ